MLLQLPVADSFLTGQVGLALEQSPTEMSSVLASMETVLSGDTRVSKLDHGVLRPSKGVSLSISREYKRSSSDIAVTFPRLLLCHRTSASQPWVPIQYLYPLSSFQGSGTAAESVYSCKMRLYVDPHTGLPVADMKQGESAAQIRQSRSFWLQVLACVVALLLIPGAFFGYSAWSEYSTVRGHEAWLRDFYTQHAPDKVPLII